MNPSDPTLSVIIRVHSWLNPRPATPKGRRAFTLVELLVVIGIIAMLIGILLPALGVARQEAKRVQCLSNLRQLAVLATLYVNDNRGVYPVSQFTADVGPLTYTYAWDFTTVTDHGAFVKALPGLLYNGRGPAAVQQCPAFEGPSNSEGDPFTGYNYNTSFIGHGPTPEGTIEPPAKAVSIRRPAAVALFGDGQWAGGANKFMRSPLVSRNDASDPAVRVAGTQGFRHRKSTNVAYCDGHAASQAERFTTFDGSAGLIAPGTGFLSANNDAYGQD